MTTRHLGSLGTVKAGGEADLVDFEWFGRTVRSSPTLSDLDYIEFMHAAGRLSTKDPASLGAVLTFAKAVIHPEDFDDFWRLARENRQDAGDLFDVLIAVIEDVTERPTERPAGSSGGPSTTTPSSMDALSSQVKRRFELEGRPDLALVVDRAAEVRAG